MRPNINASFFETRPVRTTRRKCSVCGEQLNQKGICEHCAFKDYHQSIMVMQAF